MLCYNKISQLIFGVCVLIVWSLVFSLKLAAAELIEKPNGEREEKLRAQHMDLGLGVQSLQHSKSVVLDSFEDDQCGDHITNQVQLSSNIVEVDEPSIDKNTNLSKPQKEIHVEHMSNELLVYHVETRNNQNVLSHEANMVLEKTIPDTDVCISESVSDCSSSGKEVFSEKFQDVVVNLDKNSAGVEIYPLEKDLKIAPDCTEGTVIDFFLIVFLFQY